MGDEQIKIKVGATGVAEAAAGIDKLTASLEKQRKTQEMISRTTQDLKRRAQIEEIKKEASAVNESTAAFARQSTSAASAAKGISEISVNTQQLRSRLGPAAALIGNLSSSFSSLVPETSAAGKSLQMLTAGSGQLLGVLSGGGGIGVGVGIGLAVGGGVIYAVAKLTEEMIGANKESERLAESTKKNAAAMDEYAKSVASMLEKRRAFQTEGDRQNALMGGTAGSRDYSDEMASIKERLSSDPSLRGGDAFDLRQRLKVLQDEREQAMAREQNERDRAELAKADFGAVDQKKGDPGLFKPQNVRDQLDQIAVLTQQSREREAELDKAILLSGFDEWKRVQDMKAEESQHSRDREYAAEQAARKKDSTDFERHMKQMGQQRSTLQDLAIQGTQMLASTSIKAFQEIAKGHKVEIGQVIEGLGDQIVAMGQGYIFKGIAESILLNPQGPALIGVGSAAVAFGIGLGAAGAHGAGGSSEAPGAKAGAGSANPFGPRDVGGGVDSGQSGPTTVNVYLSSTVAPNADDGERVRQALKELERKRGLSP